MSKKCLNKLIFELESFDLKVLLSVCDQGDDNEGLQKNLADVGCSALVVLQQKVL